MKPLISGPGGSRNCDLPGAPAAPGCVSRSRGIPVRRPRRRRRRAHRFPGNGRARHTDLGHVRLRWRGLAWRRVPASGRRRDDVPGWRRWWWRGRQRWRWRDGRGQLGRDAGRCRRGAAGIRRRHRRRFIDVPGWTACDDDHDRHRKSRSRRSAHDGRHSLGAVPGTARVDLEVPRAAAGQLRLPGLAGRHAVSAVARCQETGPLSVFWTGVPDGSNVFARLRGDLDRRRRLEGLGGNRPPVRVVLGVVPRLNLGFFGRQVTGVRRRNGLGDQRTAVPPVLVVGVVQLAFEVQIPENLALGHGSMLTPPTSWQPFRYRTRSLSGSSRRTRVAQSASSTPCGRTPSPTGTHPSPDAPPRPRGSSRRARRPRGRVDRCPGR